MPFIILGQKNNMIGEPFKYLVFGNGESVHLLKWVRELQKYFDVIVVSSLGFMPELDKLLTEDRKYSFKIKQNENGASTGFLGKLSQLKRIINHTKPSFVNAHYISSHGFLVALAKIGSKHKFTFIASAWGTDVLVFPWKNKLFFYSIKFILTKADWVTSDSDYMSSIIKKIKNREVLTFTFGLDSLPNYDDTKKDENLYFSNRMLTKNYNIDQVLIAFSKIFQKNNQARLLLSHKGDEKENLEKLSIDLGLEKAVDFIGFIREAEQIDIYSRACCYFSLPTSDSTSVSLLEALAYGCIPILSDIPANKEWVVDGKNGLIISEDIPLDKLQRLRKNRTQIAQKNREIIAQKAIFPHLISQFVGKIANTKEESNEFIKDLVSVITPSYNSALFISETIESVLAQSYQKWEMIIVDDCSTDHSRDIIQQYCNKDKRIKQINLTDNSGAAIARNTALLSAKGQYIAFLDSDDIWMPNKLHLQLSFMKNNNTPISFTAYQVFNEVLSDHLYSIDVPDIIDYTGYLKNTIIGMSTAIIDKAEIGIFEFYNIRTRQDTYLWISLLKKGYNAYGFNTPLMKYRVRKESISANKLKAVQRVWFLYYHLEKLGFFKSLYYLSCYGFNALKKRRKK